MATPGNPRIPDVKNVTGFIPHTRRNPLSVKKSVYKKYNCEADNSSNQEIYCNFFPHFFIIVLISFYFFLIICPFIHTLFHSFLYTLVSNRTRHRQFLPNAWRYKKTGPEFLFQTCFSYLITKS